MANFHAPLQSLGPAEWDSLQHNDMGTYFNDILSQAMIIGESIPSPSSAVAPTTPQHYWPRARQDRVRSSLQ
ncbi:hypothetical protein NQ176_g825 [Zarea fungicola]|uniref:Uncharacterized protein n=1 Tax=Zarea fungicola TaxID=93591 RepID=A0ACC1NXP5_9HYPO|nr:hypothetical protein NQ176_g825 [Lecanicillium fungicola]